MPAYNITIDSKFNPYSLQDRLLPIQMLQEQHNQAADAYATALANSAGLYDALRVNEEDALAAKYVNDYENSLQELADDLATNGLNRTNRRGVYEIKAKTGYIEKLKKAIDNRNTFIAQQNELINRDSSLVISDYAANHGITRFLNPDFQYRSYSKNALRQQAAKLFEELSKSTYLDPNNPEYKHIAGLTMEMGIKAGLKSKDIQSAIDDIREHGMNNKSSKTTQILGNIAQGILISNLGEKENNPYWSNDQWDTAMREIMDESWHALGTEDFKTVNIDEPRASGSGNSKDDWLLDPTFIQILTAHKNKIEGFDNLQKEAIDNSISYLGGDDETTEMYKRGVGFSPVSTFTNIETLRNNIKKAIDSNDIYVKKRDSEGNPITYSKEGEEALKILGEYIREVNGIQLTDEKKAARLEQLRKQESEQLGRYRNGATGNATTAYMNTFNLGVPMLNDEERIEKEALEAENDALIKAGVSRFYHKFDYRDDDPTIEQIKRNLRYGEQLTDAQKDYIETRRQNYIKNHPEVKETENRRKKALDLIREAQDFFREGAILSDVIDLSRGIDDPNVIWRNIATDVRTEQAQDYLGKDRNGRFIDNRKDKPITDYEQLYDKENGELKKGVHIAFDTDSDGKLGYVLFTDDPNGQRAFMEANPTSKSIDYSGMLSYANSMSNQQKINRELSSLRDSDEYIRAMYNAQRKGGINLTTEERNIINYEKQLLEMLKIAEQVSENAGREGFTNFYNQTTLSRKRYVEDPNKQIQVNNYGYNGYEGY